MPKPDEPHAWSAQKTAAFDQLQANADVTLNAMASVYQAAVRQVGEIQAVRDLTTGLMREMDWPADAAGMLAMAIRRLAAVDPS